ncbi:MAG TPA: hypothetical protein IAC67_02910 [Candidatus Coproplasma excrementipullorum]|nr:hypothetical protein [Candidatus Coproplasma excrementipullorum]
MKQKSRIASKLFAVLVVLTLISCCFLGTTFARYTSGQSGVASVNVAKWGVEFKQGESEIEENFDLNIGKLSPKMTDYAGSSKTDVTNTISGKNMVTITNSGEVDAKITISQGTVTYNLVSGSSWGSGMSYSEGSVSGTPSQEQIEGKDPYTTPGAILTITVKVVTTGNVTESGGVYTLPANSSSNTNITISVSATWTTHYAESKSSGALEDAIDTWLGENLESITVSVDVTAVQASEQPTT